MRLPNGASEDCIGSFKFFIFYLFLFYCKAVIEVKYSKKKCKIDKTIPIVRYDDTKMITVII